MTHREVVTIIHILLYKVYYDYLILIITNDFVIDQIANLMNTEATELSIFPSWYKKNLKKVIATFSQFKIFPCNS